MNIGKAERRYKRQNMRELLANTMPASKSISQCLLKASNTKHDQVQEDKQ